MTIKTPLPWPVRLAFVAGALGMGAIAMWAYNLDRGIAGLAPAGSGDRVAAYMEEIDRLKLERDQFSATVNVAESQLNIERSAQKQLAAQVKGLETENVRLKEDLAFFESLLPADTGSQGVSIRRLKAELMMPNQLRYRLLVMQGGKGSRDFVGDVQLTLSVVQGGKSAMMIFPDGNSTEVSKFKLVFRHYQRVEGILNLPEGVSIKAVQARVLEKGQVRAQQFANL